MPTPRTFGGLRGLKGQSMTPVRKGTSAEVVGFYKKTSSTGTITAPNYQTICTAMLWGAGGGGEAGTRGGSGGGAILKRFRCGPGASLPFSVGAGGAAGVAGGDTTLTMPSGRVLTAPGGPTTGGATSTPTDGDVNRKGGVGGNSVNGTAGENGGAGGAVSVNGGGGGAAGFDDLGDGLDGGDGGAGGAAGVAPGGGGGGNSGAGAAGQVLVFFVRVRD